MQLEVIIAAQALNLGRSWWTVASQIATLANFYLTTWEEYHTGGCIPAVHVTSSEYLAIPRPAVPCGVLWARRGHSNDSSNLHYLWCLW